jgi:hypothetical protein
MGRLRNRLRKVGQLALRAHGIMAKDPRSYFYGDSADVKLDPEVVAESVFENSDTDPSEVAIVESAPEGQAVDALTGFKMLSPDERAQKTFIPPISPINAVVIQNPLLGRISAFHLNYHLTKSLVEYPFQGQTFNGSVVSNGTSTITVATTQRATFCVPLCTLVISNSALNTPAGGLITVSFKGEDLGGNQIDTTPLGSDKQYQYVIQRLGSTDPVRTVFIPFSVIATRTLSFMPVFSGDGSTSVKTFQVQLDGLAPTDSCYLTVLGYASSELKEIAQRLNLPAGDII